MKSRSLRGSADRNSKPPGAPPPLAVALFAGARIETVAREPCGPRKWSLSSRERGSKRLLVPRLVVGPSRSLRGSADRNLFRNRGPRHAAEVALFAGARIETITAGSVTVGWSSLSSRERGSKHFGYGRAHHHLMSLSSRERGSKRWHGAHRDQSDRSLSSRERGSKQAGGAVEPMRLVALFAGARIETPAGAPRTPGATGSLSSRERGSKLGIGVVDHEVGGSLSSRERGSKLCLITPLRRLPWGRSLRGSADRNFAYFCRALRRRSRSLRGSADRNRCFPATYSCGWTVALFAGARIETAVSPLHIRAVGPSLSSRERGSKRRIRLAMALR